MSDNTLTVTEVVNSVTVTPVNNTVTVSDVGVQGPAGATGATGATGAQGSSGVVTVNAPLTNAGTSSAANLSISAGTTSAAGALQLTDSVSSTSTTTAATPNAVKSAYDLANLRDPIVKRQSTTYFTSPNYVTTAAMTVTNQRAYYSVIYIDQTTTVDRIAIRTSTSFSGTGSVRLGIYNHNYATGQPSTVLLDAGTVSPSATSTVYEITISQTLNIGFYWLVMAQQGTAPTTGSYLANSVGSTFNLYMQTFTSPGGNQHAGYTQNSVTGAFADAGSISISAQVPFVWLRAS